MSRANKLLRRVLLTPGPGGWARLRDLVSRRYRARAETTGEDPFAAFSKWASAADEAAYRDLRAGRRREGRS